MTTNTVTPTNGQTAAAVQASAVSPLNRSSDIANANGQTLPVSGQTKPLKPTAEAVGAAVSQINDHLQTVRRNIEFSVDKVTGQIVVKVLDAKTHKLVREIPPEVVLQLADAFKKGQDGMGGLIVRERA